MSIPLWKTLFRKALACMDTLAKRKIKVRWSFGGGTAMMMTYSHRDSKDIDIFINDPQLIGYLSPRLQDDIQAITDYTGYDERATILKLILDNGEIDFIVAATLTKHPFEDWKFEGREIIRERPVEIVAKKVFYRADDFMVRDVFDFACLLDREPDAVAKEEALFHAKKDVILTRLETMKPTYVERAKQLIAVRPGFEGLRDTAIERVLEFYQ